MSGTRDENPRTQGIHHIGLSVSNLQACADFFINLLKFRKVGERPEYPAIYVSDETTLITLWQVADPENYVSFDRRNNVGLHHLALAVRDSISIDTLYNEMVKEGIDIEFPPTLKPDGVSKHMMCFIPGGPRVEFFTSIINE